MSTRRLLLTVSLSAMGAAGVHAQSGGNDLPRGFRTLAGVTLNRDSAATIRAKLGVTREESVGAGHDAYESWCYVPAAASHSLLQLMSDASVMGTPGRSLNVIRLRADAPATERQGCAALPASAQLSTPAGLRLGLSLSTIEKLLGKPTRRAADSVIYVFAAREFMRPGTPQYETWNTPENRESCFDAGPPYANISAMVIARLRADRAVEIRIERYDQAAC